LDAEWRSIGAGRLPSNGASQGDQGKRGRDPERGTARRKHRLQSSRRHRGPGPLSTLTRLVPEIKQKGARPSEYSLRRRTTPTDELSHPLGRHPVRLAGAQHRSITSRGKIAEIPFGRIP